MSTDLDIYRAANILVQRQGSDAELVAAQRSDLMLERGDLDGLQLRKRIRRAIVELQAPPGGNRIHERALFGEVW